MIGPDMNLGSVEDGNGKSSAVCSMYGLRVGELGFWVGEKLRAHIELWL